MFTAKKSASTPSGTLQRACIPGQHELFLMAPRFSGIDLVQQCFLRSLTFDSANSLNAHFGRVSGRICMVSVEQVSANMTLYRCMLARL